MSRLEELWAKVKSTPLQVTMEEAMELQRLAKTDKSTVGQRTARATVKAGKAVKRMSLADLEAQLKQLQLLQQPPQQG